MQSVRTTCPLCEAPGPSRRLLDVRHLSPNNPSRSPPCALGVVRCRRCGTVRLDPRLDDQSLLQLQEQLLLVDAAGTHSFEAGNSNPAYAVMLAALLRRWGMPDRGGRLLDVGCGGGDLLADVAARLEARGAGLELANAAVERARARFPQHAWICGGADQDSFPDGSFEAITLIHVLEHLAEPKHALRRFHRWLAPGGLLVVEVPNGEFYFSRLYTLLFEFPKSLLARVQRMTGRRVPFTVRGFYPYHLTLFGSGSLSRMGPWSASRRRSISPSIC